MSDLADKRTGRGNEIVTSKFLTGKITELTGVDVDLLSQDEDFKAKILDLEVKLQALTDLVAQKNAEYDTKFDVIENPEQAFTEFTAEMTGTNQATINITSTEDTTHIITLIGDDGL